MKRNRSILTVLLFLLIYPYNFASGAEDSISVKLIVTAETPAFKSKIKSFMSRELRSLKDVNLVGEQYEADFEILAIALENKTVGGVLLGFSLAVFFSIPYDTFLIHIYNERFCNNNEIIKSLINDTLKYQNRLVRWEIRTGPTESLRNICEEIVIDFDLKWLEEYRKVRRSIRKK